MDGVKGSSRVGGGPPGRHSPVLGGRNSIHIMSKTAKSLQHHQPQRVSMRGWMVGGEAPRRGRRAGWPDLGRDGMGPDLDASPTVRRPVRPCSVSRKPPADARWRGHRRNPSSRSHTGRAGRRRSTHRSRAARGLRSRKLYRVKVKRPLTISWPSITPTPLKTQSLGVVARQLDPQLELTAGLDEAAVLDRPGLLQHDDAVAKSSSSRTSQAPACVRASSIKTPGITGNPGKVVAQILLRQRQVLHGRQPRAPDREASASRRAGSGWSRLRESDRLTRNAWMHPELAPVEGPRQAPTRPTDRADESHVLNGTL